MGNHTDVHGVVSGGRLHVSALPAHDSVFYRFSTGSDVAMTWMSIVPEVAEFIETRPQSSMSSSLTACERVRGPEECRSLTTCEQQCAAAGHCCVGAISGGNIPVALKGASLHS